jgi:hypothetical protein
MNNIRHIVIVGALLVSSAIAAIDNPHFYRATNAIFNEPRIENDHLTSFDATLAGGSTTKSRNSCHDIVPLFDLYGTTNIRTLALNIPNQDPTNPYQHILDNLATITADNPFGTLSIDGTFKIIESNLSYTHNLPKGFLLYFHLPVRNLQIQHPTFTDFSPNAPAIPNKNNPEWQQFLHNFTPIMNHYGINTCPTSQTGIGDFTTLIGITHNYQDTKVLDFIDGTIALGVLAPTGKKKNENKLFSLPLGYNGHWGFPVNGMISIGTYEWITLGAYAHGLFFLKNNRSMRLKTAEQQSGIIKLAIDNTTVTKGAIWNTGIVFKADHFIYGLSFMAAYSYAGEQKNHLTPCNPDLFNTTIVNSDPMLKGWNMHTVHLVAEYDFAKQNSKMGPRLGAFYNCQVRGTRVFKTNVAGGSFGLDIGWDL